jgi:hypothetical protein
LDGAIAEQSNGPIKIGLDRTIIPSLEFGIHQPLTGSAHVNHMSHIEDLLERQIRHAPIAAKAGKMVPGILIIGSLPESDAEAGGERGTAALRRLEKVFGRVQPLSASKRQTYSM